MSTTARANQAANHSKVQLRIRKCVTPRKLRRTVGRAATWWIEGLPDYYVDEDGPYVRCGPYFDYQEAKSDKDGMQRVFDNENYT